RDFHVAIKERMGDFQFAGKRFALFAANRSSLHPGVSSRLNSGSTGTIFSCRLQIGTPEC
ncbi:MAG TPA: hypothetical protein VKA27_11525, partial [Sunxiuqinia sp.]|nr:hypothetical protein [Sunxiuqinia sp.]